MLSSDLRMAKTIMNSNLDEAQERAETEDLLHQAGIESRGWFSLKGCWLLCQLGRMLVNFGKRLEQYGLPRAQLVEG